RCRPRIRSPASRRKGWATSERTQSRRERAPRLPSITRAMSAGRQDTVPPASLDDLRAGLGGAAYLASEPATLVSFLAYKLGKPVLVEGPAGVGKTELAKALSRYGERRLVRLQC